MITAIGSYWGYYFFLAAVVFQTNNLIIDVLVDEFENVLQIYIRLVNTGLG